jgi:hypothetical protein
LEKVDHEHSVACHFWREILEQKSAGLQRGIVVPTH